MPDLYKAKLSDYLRSGYDRGHMAPAADCKYSQNAMDETFYLSNIAPQVGDGFNRDCKEDLSFIMAAFACGAYELPRSTGKTD